MLAMEFYRELGVTEQLLKINSVGTPECRPAFRAALQEFARPFLSELSAEGQHRFEANPLRMLDTKDKNDLRLLEGSPRMVDFLDPESAAHFAALQEYLRSAGIPYGLVVDHVLDMEEIVVKPAAQTLKDVRIFSGNTILGDGSVIMILDPSELLRAANIGEEAASQPLAEEKKLIESTAQENLLLLFKAGDKTLKAAPLKMVQRLREIRTMDIELSNGRPVLQHLGRLMPIFSYSDAPVERENSFLIVFEHDGRNVGLLVDQVLDIAKYNGALAQSSKDKLLDTIILNQQSTDVVNPLWYIASGGSPAGDA